MEANTNNVILGPWALGLPDHARALQHPTIRDIHAQALVEEVSGDLFDHLSDLGFDLDISSNVDYTKDLAIIVESIRSYVMKRNGRYHPLQEVAAELFEYNEEGQLFTHRTLMVEFDGTIDPPKRQ